MVDRPEPSIRAHHQELTDEARVRHDALTAAIDRLERALAAPAAQRARPWSERVEGDLERVQQAVRAHIESVEASGGLFDEIRSHAPRLDPRVEALKADHTHLIGRSASFASRISAQAGADFGALRREASALLAELRAHRAAEADLVYEAFWIDLGAGD